MSSRASGGALTASLITAAIVGFAGGAYFGTQAGADENNGGPDSAATTPGGPAAGGGSSNPSASDEPTDQPSAGLTLASRQTSVESNGVIELSGGIVPAAAGVQVQLQRSVEGGAWEDFNVSPWTTDDQGAFNGQIQSQRQGVNGLRVVRIDDTSVMSNVVEVTVG